MFGKMSVDIRVMVTTPTSTIKMAMTVKLYGRLRARRTIHIVLVSALAVARVAQVFAWLFAKRQSVAAPQNVAVIGDPYLSLVSWSAATLRRFSASTRGGRNLPAFASKSPPAFRRSENSSCRGLLVFHQPFEIAQVLFQSVRETWRIENRADLQRHFRFPLRTRLEGNHA